LSLFPVGPGLEVNSLSLRRDFGVSAAYPGIRNCNGSGSDIVSEQEDQVGENPGNCYPLN